MWRGEGERGECGGEGGGKRGGREERGREGKGGVWRRGRGECGGEGEGSVEERERRECRGEGEESAEGRGRRLRLHWLSLLLLSYLHDEAEGVRGGDGPPSYWEWCVQVVVQPSRQLHLGAMLRGREVKRQSCEEV